MHNKKWKGFLIFSTWEFNITVFYQLGSVPPSQNAQQGFKNNHQKVMILFRKCTIKNEKVFWFLVLENLT